MRKYVSAIALAVLLLLVVPAVVLSIVMAADYVRDRRGSKSMFGSLTDTGDLESRLLRRGADAQAEALVAMHFHRYRLEASDLKLLLRLACERHLNELDRDHVVTIFRDSMGLHESELVAALVASGACKQSAQVREIVHVVLLRFDSDYPRFEQNETEWLEGVREHFEKRKAEGAY